MVLELEETDRYLNTTLTMLVHLERLWFLSSNFSKQLFKDVPICSYPYNV